MKPTNRLTELSIKQAKPKEKQYKLTDGEGMYLRVYPNGSKYWQLQYWFDGKQKILSIGVWPDVSLINAREKRYEAKKKIKDGINPIEEKRKERQDTLDQAHKVNLETQKQKTTFRLVAQEWYKRVSLQWTEKHTKDVLRSLQNYVYPDFGERPISEITKQDVIANLRKLESKGIHETCYRVRQKLEAIFEYAEIEEHCIGNPAKNLQKIFTKPQPKNHASLPISELPVFLKKIVDDSGAFPTTKLAIMFMIHVFVRTNSLRHAMWNDFNLESDDPLWIVPGYDMKNGLELHVPLSSQSVKILEDMKLFSGPDGFVFPQVRNPQKAMSENTLLYFSYRLGYAGRSTIHGFRTVASTSLHNSKLWDHDAVEKQLSHLVGTKVSRAYNKAEHLKERRKMLQWWSDYVDVQMHKY
jgi:integrase